MTRVVVAVTVLAGALLLASSRPAEAVSYLNTYGAIGSPSEDVGRATDAGVVHILALADSTEDPYLSDTITRATLGGTPTAGDRFGAVVQMADLNDDNKDDLVIGAPGADRGAGRVYVVYFDTDLRRFDVRHPVTIAQGRAGLPGTSEPGDGFGSSLDYISPDLHGAWLAIGAPGEDVKTVTDAGAVTLVPDGVDVTHGAVYYQGNGIPGTPEKGDGFGHAIAQFGQGFAASAPYEDVGATRDAGDITGWDPEVLGSGVELHQGSSGVPGPSEPGDHFGAALTSRERNTISIGVPGEDIAGKADAGSVIDLLVPGGCCSETTLWYQGFNGLEGKVEAGDRFGAALAPIGAGGLAVGAPGEDVGADADTGIVHLIPRSEAGGELASYGNCQYHQDSPDVPGTAEDGDLMGASLGVTFGGTLLIGMPGEDVHGSATAGAVIALGLDDGFAIATNSITRQFTQDDLTGSSAEPGDRFGTALTVVY